MLSDGWQLIIKSNDSANRCLNVEAIDNIKPPLEVVGDVNAALSELATQQFGPYQWSGDECAAFLRTLERTLRPARLRLAAVAPGGAVA